MECVLTAGEDYGAPFATIPATYTVILAVKTLEVVILANTECGVNFVITRAN